MASAVVTGSRQTPRYVSRHDFFGDAASACFGADGSTLTQSSGRVLFCHDPANR